MPAQNGNGQSWFRLPHGWEMDTHLIGLPEGARLLFIRVIDFCDVAQNSGTFSVTQLHALSRGLTRGKQCADRLLASGALTANSSLADGRQSVSITNADRWLPANNPPKPISAAKKANAPMKVAEKAPRGGAREVLQTDRQTEEGRTPSESVRPSSARAAPRVAGGATQPTPDPVVDPGGTLSRAEAIALARENIRIGRAKNPAATGIDTKFSRYDPDRPITPITSAMIFGEADE